MEKTIQKKSTGSRKSTGRLAVVIYPGSAEILTKKETYIKK